MDFLPKIIAHRGAPRLAPENTHASMLAAIKKGARYIEFDVMLTKDNVAVIFHDKTLVRTTSGTGKLCEITFKKLQTLDAGSWFDPKFKTEKVPTLEEYVKTAATHQLGINIELKATPGYEEILAEKVLHTLEKHWSSKLPPPLISSFSASSLKATREKNCPYPLGLNIDTWRIKNVYLAEELKCYSIHVKEKKINQHILQTHLAHGFKTLAYTVNNKERAQQLFEQGVVAVFSDIPDLV